MLRATLTAPRSWPTPQPCPEQKRCSFLLKKTFLKAQNYSKTRKLWRTLDSGGLILYATRVCHLETGVPRPRRHRQVCSREEG